MMRPMEEAPDFEVPVLMKWANTNQYCIARGSTHTRLYGTGGYMFEAKYFAGWYDLAELTAASEKAAKYEKALVAIRDLEISLGGPPAREKMRQIAREALGE